MKSSFFSLYLYEEYWFAINLVIFTDIQLEPATFRETGTTRQLSSPREATL